MGGRIGLKPIANRIEPRSPRYLGVANLGFIRVIIVAELRMVVNAIKKFRASFTSSQAKTYIENGYIPPVIRKQMPV